MTQKLMTLAEALATNRPLKHKSWTSFHVVQNLRIPLIDAYEPVWQVQEEPEPPLRVWSSVNGQFDVSRKAPFDVSLDVTERLAEALAPYLNKKGE